MTRFVLIFLFAAAVFGVTLMALNQPTGGNTPPAGKADPSRPASSDPTAGCPTCPLPTN